MATIIRINGSEGYIRSTGLKMPDGRIGVLRIGHETWDPSQTWRHWRGCLKEYPNEQAWRDAMDEREFKKQQQLRFRPWLRYCHHIHKKLKESNPKASYRQALREAAATWATMSEGQKNLWNHD